MPEHRKCFPYGAGIRGSGTWRRGWGVASNCYLELSATACGFAIRHVDYLSTETRNSRNSIRASAQFLVSQDAGRERYVQQKGVSRLPAQLMEIAKSRLRELR